MFIISLLFSSIIRGVGYIGNILELKSKIATIRFKSASSQGKFYKKGFHIQDVNKWYGEWSEPRNTNAAYKGFAKHLDHV
jgi:hypothetical protein